MKYKNLFTVLFILIILLFYNMFCYALVNANVKEASKYALDSYFNESMEYDYVMATNNSNDSINVFVKSNNKYYRFVMVKNGAFYTIREVNDNIPIYVLRK